MLEHEDYGELDNAVDGWREPMARWSFTNYVDARLEVSAWQKLQLSHSVPVSINSSTRIAA